MDESKKNKINWLAVLIVVLLSVLITQTAYLIYLQSGGRTAAPPASAYRSVAKPALAPSRAPAAPPADPWDVMSAFDREWDPFREMEQMRRAMNRMFRESYSHGARSGAAGVPALSYNPDLDLSETADGYVVRLDLPGIDKDKISVKVVNGMLVLSGERQAETEQASEDGGFYRTERSFGSFARSFPLPPDADSSKMTAESKNGVLTVRIPKIAGAAKTSASIPVQ